MIILVFYLHGDIESSEKDILSEFRDSKILESIVIKIAHHGAKTSSSEAFLKAVNPKIALIGVGQNNKFGHPSNITIEKLKSIGCRIYRTDLNGEIEIELNKRGKLCISKMLN